MLNSRFNEFCDRWLEKARHYSEDDLAERFDKFFTLFVVYNALYVETAAYLHRKAQNEERNDYRLEGDNFPDQAAATKYILDLLTSRRLIDALEGDNKSRKAMKKIVNLMEKRTFNIQLDPVWGSSQVEKDQKLLTSLKSNSRDERARAILTFVYSIRCNMFHGRKSFTEHQDQLLEPSISILERVIDLLYRELKSVST